MAAQKCCRCPDDVSDAETSPNIKSEYFALDVPLGFCKWLIRKKIVEYGDIAKLNADGSTGLVKKGGGLSGGDTAITPKAEKIWIYSGENNDVRQAKCDKKGMEAAKQIVKEHPTFPFSYYMLSVCHKARREQEWITYSQQALDILEFTTQVPAHNRHHDTAKQRLDDWMGQVQGNLQTQ